MTQMEYNDFHLFGRLVNRPSEQPTTVPIRRINVKFSTKAETLQAQQAGAQLFVCAEASQLSNPTALALFASLEEGQNFADTKIPTDNGLQAIAVARLAEQSRSRSRQMGAKSRNGQCGRSRL